MAEHTVTTIKLDHERRGHRKIRDFSFDITAAGADGYSLTAGSGDMTEFVKIASVLITGVQETGGYVMQYHPTTLPTAADPWAGNGKLRVYEAGADGAVLDEVTSGDLGVFIVRVEGW